MKLSKRDIDDFFREGKEKPILFKNGKMLVPTYKGYVNNEKQKKVKKNGGS